MARFQPSICNCLFDPRFRCLLWRKKSPPTWAKVKPEKQATADELGQFSFVDLVESEYVVELLGPDGSVVAASEVVKASKGRLLRTIVRVAAAATAVVTVLSHRLSPSVRHANALATSNDVTPTTTTQVPRVTSTGN